MLPYLMCDSVTHLCRKYDVEMCFYHIDKQFRPLNVHQEDNTWLYIMNYYGQLTKDELTAIVSNYDSVIVDNAQAYFEKPIPYADTIYTCRKFFGVPDGAFLYTNTVSDIQYPVDESFERMHFLLGRFERSASEFYQEYTENNHLFETEPIKQMSKLTNNLLHGIDYVHVCHNRTRNFRVYHEAFQSLNELHIHEVEGAFAYPLLLKNGREIRKELQRRKIYVPTLWPNVLNRISIR